MLEKFNITFFCFFTRFLSPQPVISRQERDLKISLFRVLVHVAVKWDDEFRKRGKSSLRWIAGKEKRRKNIDLMHFADFMYARPALCWCTGQ
jgi:hypothetical protein